MRAIGDVLQRDPAAVVNRPRNLPPATEDLIDVNEGAAQPPLWLSRREIAELGYKQVTNWAGRRVWVSPLLWVEGEPVYAPLHESPDQDQAGNRHRERQAAMTAASKARLDAKKRRGAPLAARPLRGFDED